MFPGATGKTQDLFTDLGEGTIPSWDDGFIYVDEWNSQKQTELMERGKENEATLCKFISRLKEQHNV